MWWLRNLWKMPSLPSGCTECGVIKFSLTIICQPLYLTHLLPCLYVGLSASFHIIGGDLNEFSFHPRGLFCYPPGRTVNLVKHDKGTISFQDFDGTCLTNNG